MHSTPAPLPPTASAIENALAAVRSPELVHDKPALRAFFWETLKRARGQRVDLARLSALQDSHRAAHLRLVINVACREIAASRHRPERHRAAFHDDVQPNLFHPDGAA